MKITNSDNVKVFLRVMVQPKTGETVPVADISLNGRELANYDGGETGKYVMHEAQSYLQNLLPVDVANEVFDDVRTQPMPLDRCRVQLPTTMPDDQFFVEFLSMNNITLTGRVTVRWCARVRVRGHVRRAARHDQTVVGLR